MKLRNLTAAGVLGTLLLPAAADAATKPVFRGPPPKGELKGVKGPVADADFYPRRITIAPTARADARRVAKQVKASTRLAKRLLAARAPAGNVVQAGSDDKGTATIAFLPEKKTIDVGESVTFKMSKRSIETHNVAFGPKQYLDKHAKAFFGPVFEPFVTFRSDAPGTPISFDGANHGNGWANTGLLDASAASPQPSSDTMTFTKAGTYKFYCAVHGNQMQGRIVVK